MRRHEQSEEGKIADEALYAPPPSRRAAVGLGVVGTLIAPAALSRWTRAAHAEAKPAPGFLDARALATLDELAEIILPTDEHAPGARAAGVAADLDAYLASLRPRIPAQRKLREAFRRGLREVDRDSRRRFSKPFLAASAEQRLQIVTDMARGEAAPQRPLEHFFVLLKREVVSSYYNSEIGIHQDIGYRGNTYLEDYVGYRPDEPLVLPDARNEEGW